MVEKYNYLFGLYLRTCKDTCDLDKRMRFCEDFKEQLIGMVNLITEMRGFTREDADKEIKKIIHEFSYIAILCSDGIPKKGDLDGSTEKPAYSG